VTPCEISKTFNFFLKFQKGTPISTKSETFEPITLAKASTFDKNLIFSNLFFFNTPFFNCLGFVVKARNDLPPPFEFELKPKRNTLSQKKLNFNWYGDDFVF